MKIHIVVVFPLIVYFSIQHSKDDQNEDVSTSKLEIKTATSDMAGKYSCKISNLGGTVSSKEVSLSISE